ncbi:hypothetical protein DFH28DRAFT_474464 [Melampsora americana]|nr:hypothetical protein DFH28DRAFT_474464 [Melampsora americana]
MSHHNPHSHSHRALCDHPSSQRPLSSISDASSTVLYIDYAQIPSPHAPVDFNFDNVLQSTPISPEHPPLEYDASFIERPQKRNAVFLENGLPLSLSAPSPTKRRRKAILNQNRNAIFIENGLPSAAPRCSPTRRRRNAVIFENGYIPTHHEYLIKQVNHHTQFPQTNESTAATSQIPQALLESGDREEGLTNQSFGWDLNAYYANEDLGTAARFDL